MEERGVPVQDDWSVGPDEDKVRFSLSGVTPHSWGKRRTHWSNTGGRGTGGEAGKGEEERGPLEGLRSPSSGDMCSEQRQAGLSVITSLQPWPGTAVSQGRCKLQSAHPARGTASAGAIQSLQLR